MPAQHQQPTQAATDAPVLDATVIALLAEASRSTPLADAARQALRQRVLARLGHATQSTEAAKPASNISQDKYAVVSSPKGLSATKMVGDVTQAEPRFIDVAQADGWRRLHAKAQVKVLFDDGISFSWLLKLAPGGALPPHSHSKGHEECIILAGSLSLNGELRGAGDYHAALHGTRHDEVHSASGCTVFLKSPSQNRAALEAALG